MWEHSTNEWPDLFKKPMSWGWRWGKQSMLKVTKAATIKYNARTLTQLWLEKIRYYWTTGET